MIHHTVLLDGGSALWPAPPTARAVPFRLRLELVAALTPHAAAAYAAVAGSPAAATLDYRTALPSSSADRPALQDALAAALTAARPTDVDRGVTTVGPHRDDLVLMLGELPAKGYASHGECWSYAIALRLAAYRLLRTDGVEPVLVLDDVFAELDTGRRDRLARDIGDATQTLVTGAVEEDVPAALRGARYEVRDGPVERVR